MDIYFIVTIIISTILYLIGEFKIEDVVVIASQSIMWIMIRLLIIQHTIEKQLKCSEEKYKNKSLDKKSLI